MAAEAEPAGAEFIGFSGARHVADKRPLAGILSVASGLRADAIHKTLVEAGLSYKNGSVDPRNIGRLRLTGKHGFVVLEPFNMDGDASREEVRERIDETLAIGRPVALAHKVSQAPQARKRDWTLLTGFYQHEGGLTAMRAIDPTRDHANYLSAPAVKSLIARSTGPDTVHAYTVTAMPPDRKLAVVYAFDQEPEPIADTYTATGQDKITWDKRPAEPVAEPSLELAA